MLRRLKLLTPLTFLRLQSADLRAYQWTIPGILALVALIGFLVLPVRPPVLTDKGLINTVNGLLNTLIGFYIAALAAIATFKNDTLDQTMKGRPPVLKVTRGGEVNEEPFTRRRFLVVLFGYCAFLAILLFGLGVVSLMVAPSFATVKFVAVLRVVWLALYFAMCASLLVSTLLGLHYLIDRMHRE